MIDVSLLAKKFGGGGHKNASGFNTKINPVTLFMNL
jgi:nanoRNase/pAp phosphatase (c-di-AMP/oligoRNAs hydrolase)